MGPKKIALALKGKTSRKQARADLGPLRDLVVANSTLLRYQRAVDAFFDYLEARECELPRCMEKLDLLICGRLEDMWQEGDAKAYAGDLLSGMAHFVETARGKLPASWAWGKAELPCRAPPLSVEIVLAMCGLALEQKDVALAAALSLGFHAFLRTGELAQLTCGDIALNLAQRTGVANLTYQRREATGCYRARRIE